MSWPSVSTTISHKSWFVLRTTEETPFERLRDDLTGVQCFLTVARGAPVFPLEMMAIVERERSERERRFLQTSTRTRREIVEIFYRPIGDLARHKPATITDHFFSFADIRQRWDTIITTWFERYYAYASVYKLYMAMVYSTYTYVEERFLFHARVVEAYHRGVIGGLLFSDDKLDAAKTHAASLILNARLEGRKELLALVLRTLNHSNEPTLRNRFKFFVNKFAPLLGLNSKAKTAFTGDVVEKRNQLIHAGGRELHRDSVTFVEQAQRLRVLLELELLESTGIPPADLARFIERHRQRRGGHWPWHIRPPTPDASSPNPSQNGTGDT